MDATVWCVASSLRGVLGLDDCDEHVGIKRLVGLAGQLRVVAAGGVRNRRLGLNLSLAPGSHKCLPDLFVYGCGGLRSRFD